MTLTEFLLARIAEDEAAAKDAGEAPWVSMETAPWVLVDPAAIREEKWRFGNQGHVASAQHGGHAAHIARHDPARVLAECEAKRQIVEELGRFLDNIAAFGAENEAPTLSCGIRRQLQHLASVYADHPDYREEWKP